MVKKDKIYFSFLKSSLTLKNPFISVNGILNWLNEQNRKNYISVEKTKFSKMKDWHFDNKNINHSSGKFFSIVGIHVKTNQGKIREWTQPIIKQPEIGYLGIITKEFDGMLYFLMQCKIEPGNINNVQLSPTLQATKSNFECVHKGKEPPYLKYFKHVQPKDVLLDQLQSEQGSRFLFKRNRNIIIKVNRSIEVLDNYVWLTLAQINALMHFNNVINMDTRTVLSGIYYGFYNLNEFNYLDFWDKKQEEFTINKQVLEAKISRKESLHRFEEIVSFITKLKCKYALSVREIALCDLVNWEIKSDCIEHSEGKYFRVIATDIEINNREVKKWSQPLVEPRQEGLCAFVSKEICGTLHFAIQMKLECGNFDLLEFAPTVQCLTDNYLKKDSQELPFLNYVLNVPKEKIIFDTLQSEEGGRFYREQNRNLIVLAGDEVSRDLPDGYIWMTFRQLHQFIRHNNYINIQARSLIAALSFLKKVD